MFSQSDYLIQVVDINSHLMTVQIQISWLLQKPADLDLHCLQWQGISDSAGQGLTCFKRGKMSNASYSRSNPLKDSAEGCSTLHPIDTCIVPDKRSVQLNIFSYFSMKTYVVGTHRSVYTRMFSWRNKKKTSILFDWENCLVWSYVDGNWSNVTFKHTSTWNIQTWIRLHIHAVY